MQTAVEERDPKSKIVDYATRWNADLVAVGLYGRKGAERFLMGGASPAVARHAPRSVEIVRILTAEED